MIFRCCLVLICATAVLFIVGIFFGEQPSATEQSTHIRFASDGESQEQAAPPPVSTLRFAQRAGAAEAAAGELPDKHAPVDPVEANGPIFVDWPAPDAVLVFSGEQEGYLEPCGCAGLQNQKGGLKRRHTLIKQMEAKGWPVVAMDLGGQVKRFGKQAQIKFDRSIESLMEIGYAAVGFSPHDLQMDILPMAINFDPPENSPFVSANVAILDYDSGMTRRFRVVEAGGMRIGVTSVLGKQQIAELQNVSSDIAIEEPYQALPQILPEMLAARCDHLVLLAHAKRDEAENLARRFHEFDWVVAAGGPDEPPNRPAVINNQAGAETARLIEVGHKGMYVVAIGLYRDGDRPYRYQRVPLDHRFKDSPEMQEIFVEYQRELETLGLELLGVEPIDHPSGRQFDGSQVCGDCHTIAHAIHEDTPHAHATERLLAMEPPRQYDPECLSCHVTGWNPQRYYPYTSGYLSLADTPHMTTNGCENCHGPAKRHVDIEYGEIDATEEQRLQARADLHLEIVENEGNMEGQVFGDVVEMCMECHDLDNSPDFDFQRYWPVVEHYGVD